MIEGGTHGEMKSFLKELYQFYKEVSMCISLKYIQ